MDEWYTGGGRVGVPVGGESIAKEQSSLIQLIPEGDFGPDIGGMWVDLEWLKEPVVQVLGWTSAMLYVSFIFISVSEMIRR